MKIIRVNGCYDCPFFEIRKDSYMDYYCRMLETEMKLKDTKTLPGNCPLEDELFTKEEIKQAEEFLKTLPDPKLYFEGMR